MTFIFTHYEFYLLLAMAEAKYFLGLRFPYLSPEEERVVFEQALDSLKERECLISQDDRLLLSPELRKQIEICATAQDVLIAAYHVLGMEPGTCLYYFSEQGIVEVKALPLSYELKEVATSDEIPQKIRDLFRLQAQPAAPGQPWKVADTVLQPIFQNSTEVTKAKTILALQDVGCEKTLATSLAEAWTDPLGNFSLSRMHMFEDRETVTDNFILLEAPCGLLETHFSDGLVSITPVNAEIALNLVAEYTI